MAYNTQNMRLVDALRHCAKRPRYSCEGCKSYVMAACLDEEEPVYTCDGKLFSQAADAIEELTRIVHEYQKFDGFLAAHGMFEQEPMRPVRDDRGQLLFYPSAEPPKEETE